MSNVDLKTKWLGLELKSPIVLGSSPLSLRREAVRQLDELGAAAVVMPSLYEEELEHDETEIQHLLEFATESTGEATEFMPELEDYHIGTRDYLENLKGIKDIVSIPVIGSICATSASGWREYAKQMESAGADAIELNSFFVPTDPKLTSADVEARYVDTVADVAKSVKIPISVKLGPYLSAPANLARRLVDAGASGLTLFNRFEQPDIDLEELHIIQDHHLSGPEDIGHTLRWIGILRGQHPEISLAATSGIHFADCVVKMLLAGADVAMMTGAVIRNGPGHLAMVLEGVRAWLEEHEDDSVEQVKGSMCQTKCEEPVEYERAHHLKPLIHYTHEA